MARSIGWLSMFVGLDFIYRRGQAMAAAAADRLAAIPGVDRPDAAGRDGDAGHVPDRGLARPGRARRARVARFPSPGRSPSLDALRLSVGFFTTDDELDRVAETVELLARHTPETLPPRRTLTHARDDRPPRPGGAPAAALVGGGPLAPVPARPAPVVRAVAASLSVAVVLAVLYLAYDVALSRGAACPAATCGRWRSRCTSSSCSSSAASSPTSSSRSRPASGTVARRNGWSAALGFFAAVPIAYLVLVVAVQVIRPLIG